MSECIRERNHSMVKSDGTPTMRAPLSIWRPTVLRSQVSKLGRVTWSSNWPSAVSQSACGERSRTPDFLSFCNSTGYWKVEHPSPG